MKGRKRSGNQMKKDFKSGVSKENVSAAKK